MIVQGGLIGPTVKHLGERTGDAARAWSSASRALRRSGWRRPGSGSWPAFRCWRCGASPAPPTLGLMSRHVGASEQGQLQGANASLMGIANLVGPRHLHPDVRAIHRRRRCPAASRRAVFAGGADAGCSNCGRLAHNAGGATLATAAARYERCARGHLRRRLRGEQPPSTIVVNLARLLKVRQAHLHDLLGDGVRSLRASSGLRPAWRRRACGCGSAPG